MADTVKSKIEQVVDGTAEGAASTVDDPTGVVHGAVNAVRNEVASPAGQGIASLKSKVFGAVKKLTGGA